MNHGLQGALALDTVVLVTIGLAVGYLAKVRMPRPPAGLFVRSDIVIMVALLVIMPFAYLDMPAALVCTVFGLTVFVGLQFTLAPLIGGRGAVAVATPACAFEIVAYFAHWSTALMLVNDVALVVVATGVTNLWVQTGMRPPLVAGFAAALVVYDTVATGLSSVTSDFMHLVNGIPFAPMLAARYTPEPIMMGLGDTLMLTLWPLVAIKSYGRAAGICAIAVDVLLMAAVFAGFATGAITYIPLLTPLGLLIVAQYFYWRRRIPVVVPVRDPLEAALRASYGEDEPADGTWVALHEGKVVGRGDSPGAARRTAREAGVAEVPVTALGRP
ncbi:hypothetical protein NE236_20465 [Actinoallomurus purpureus]|uniref:hypothetical protein n=1 Tax=Actinoallomurus purpureus TaxID=478114 RepID=UPI002093E8BA|nr:hypothetical protein [Actinoallomurus purpureus]MCO6007357.1 hypothetical protein [Actinoallomurus purpureus]